MSNRICKGYQTEYELEGTRARARAVAGRLLPRSRRGRAAVLTPRPRAVGWPRLLLPRSSRHAAGTRAVAAAPAPGNACLRCRARPGGPSAHHCATRHQRAPAPAHRGAARGRCGRAARPRHPSRRGCHAPSRRALAAGGWM
jgi:hypothetical protein